MQEKKKLIFITIFILTFIIINLIMTKDVQAGQTSNISTQIDQIDDSKYPGIKKMIQELQEKHKSWNFKILYTGLDWNDVIEGEYVGHGDTPTNLVPVGAAFTGEWICESCTADRYYDSGKWHCASKKAIEYMIDPRNSINNSDVFQFMELTYQECNEEDIKKMVVGTFLDNNDYIKAIIQAGRKNNISPYYIIALAIQEQGSNGSSTTSGKYPGYEGYYNIFNIGATGNDPQIIIQRALSRAKEEGWTTIIKSIEGGVECIATNYIEVGQNTLYLQKFDVDNSDGKLYWHQYQQNIMAAQNEGVSIRKTFEKIDSMEAAYTFVIPVYENMPEAIAKKPQKDVGIDTTGAEQVRVNVRSTINLRATPNGQPIGLLYADEIVLRLELAKERINGTYWDKVMKNSGVIGYVARETEIGESEYKLYLIPIEEESNDSNSEDEKVKIEEELKQITITPKTTIEDIAKALGTEIKITDQEGNEKETIGTGSKINGTYIVTMLGDGNGDGRINSGDLFYLQKYLLENTKAEEYIKKAIDVNKDGKINSGDLFAIQNYLLGNRNITIN